MAKNLRIAILHWNSQSKFILTVTVCVASLVLSFSLGPDGFGFDWQHWTPETRDIILWNIRLPRVLLAALCGGALGVAGVLSQGLFRNPLADPSVLGSINGANLFVIFLMFLGWQKDYWFAQPLAAFLGATCSTLLVLYASRSRALASPGRLLLMGLALNALFSAITTFLLSLSLHKYDLSQSILYWLMGGFNGKGWEHMLMGLPFLVLGLLWSLSFVRKLDLINLGEDIAQSLSVSVQSLQKEVILVVSLLIAASVAVAGGVAFVGLIVPHFTRLYMGASHRRLGIASFFNGVSLVVIADSFARTLWSPQELQVGALLSLLGAPTFILLLLASRKKGTL